MIFMTQSRILRTSLRVHPPKSPIAITPGLLSIRRRVPLCLTPSAPRSLSTTSHLSTNEASKSPIPTHDTELAPNHRLSPTAANPPATTRPPPLDLPARDPNQGTFSFYFATGKAYLTFYKTGLKNIYLNTRLVWSLDAAATATATADTPTPGAIAHPPASRPAGATTRSTLLLRRRWRYDVRRLPPFALLLLICGEFTPLVVMALPSMVPYTCRIPRQIEALQRKTEARRAASFWRLYDHEVEQGRRAPGDERPPGNAAAAATAAPEVSPSSRKAGFTDAQRAAHIARSLDLISPLWDRLGVPDAAVVLLSARRKVKRHVAFLAEDDVLLTQAGGVDALESEEVVLACTDRAIGTLTRSDEDLRGRLRQWLRYVPEQRDSSAQVQLLTDRLLNQHDWTS